MLWQYADYENAKSYDLKRGKKKPKKKGKKKKKKKKK